MALLKGVHAHFGAGVGVDGIGGAGLSIVWHFTEELEPLKKEKTWYVSVSLPFRVFGICFAGVEDNLACWPKKTISLTVMTNCSKCQKDSKTGHS